MKIFHEKISKSSHRLRRVTDDRPLKFSLKDKKRDFNDGIQIGCSYIITRLLDH